MKPFSRLLVRVGLRARNLLSLSRSFAPGGGPEENKAVLQNQLQCPPTLLARKTSKALKLFSQRSVERCGLPSYNAHDPGVRASVSVIS